MGDFNCKYDDYIEITSKNTTKYHWKMNIFKKLQQYNMTDTTSLAHDISSNNPQHTFIRGNSRSRIDYIWMNQELCINIVNNKTEESFLFKTDHMIVNTNLYPEAITGLSSYAELKRSKVVTKKVINYDNTTDQQWESFKQVQDDFIIDNQLLQYDLSTYNTVNTNWNEIQKCFIEEKKE